MAERIHYRTAAARPTRNGFQPVKVACCGRHGTWTFMTTSDPEEVTCNKCELYVSRKLGAHRYEEEYVA